MTIFRNRCGAGTWPRPAVIELGEGLERGREGS
jgi:hypothetical protein